MKTKHDKYDQDCMDAAASLWAKLQELPAHQQHDAICAVLKDYACEADMRIDEGEWAQKYRAACIELSCLYDDRDRLDFIEKTHCDIHAYGVDSWTVCKCDAKSLRAAIDAAKTKVEAGADRHFRSSSVAPSNK